MDVRRKIFHSSLVNCQSSIFFDTHSHEDQARKELGIEIRGFLGHAFAERNDTLILFGKAAIPMLNCSSAASIFLPGNGFDAEDEGFFVCDDEASYRPRNPEDNPLYAVVAEHLETFLARQQERDRPVPHFVERELRAFLDCGILANGFLRVRCDACGKDRVVPFSCKWTESTIRSCAVPHFSSARRFISKSAAYIAYVLQHITYMLKWTWQ
jgi:hypothetical protein